MVVMGIFPPLFREIFWELVKNPIARRPKRDSGVVSSASQSDTAGPDTHMLIIPADMGLSDTKTAANGVGANASLPKSLKTFMAARCLITRTAPKVSHIFRGVIYDYSVIRTNKRWVNVGLFRQLLDCHFARFEIASTQLYCCVE